MIQNETEDERIDDKFYRVFLRKYEIYVLYIKGR